MMLLQPELAAGGALAVGAQSQLRIGMLPRVLGLYIAVSAGTIQLLDIVVDRLALPDRLFFFAIVIAVIGLPIVATATLMLDVARADRRTPARRNADVASRTAVSTVATNAAHHASAAYENNTAADPNGFAARVELALSYRRIAEIRRATGALDEARVNDAAFAREAERIIADLRALIDSTSHDDFA